MKKIHSKLFSVIIGAFLLANIQLIMIEDSYYFGVQELSARQGPGNPIDCWDDVTVSTGGNFVRFCKLTINGDEEVCKMALVSHYDGLNTCFTVDPE